jgi:hypothetical protein
MGSSLHLKAKDKQPDISAFIYGILRLPFCIVDVERIVLGQSEEVFIQEGVGEVESWRPVLAKARRRRSFFDGKDTLACFIGSRSDIDDMIPILTAFQIEWNKLSFLLRGDQVRKYLENPIESEEGIAVLAEGIDIDAVDLRRLQSIWEDDFWPVMQKISTEEKRFRVRLLASSLKDYRRATQMWWDAVEVVEPSLIQRPVYFVSSNTHSLVNLVSGYALRHEGELIDYLEGPDCADLKSEWDEIQKQHVRSSRENFLYYVLKKYLSTPDGNKHRAQRVEAESAIGIKRIPSRHVFDVEVQIIDLSRLKEDWIDPRLHLPGFETLADSDALIVNIDYPLGVAAYLLLSHIATRVGEMRGIYIMGKAATLNGVVGDIMIPNVIHDEQSQNTYLFENCFSAVDLGEDLLYGSVLDNQKAVSVRGTFLQTPSYMDVFYREGYTDIEMEAGSYLSAIYEMFRPKRYPDNEIVNLHGLGFDLGVLHYASDTPLSEGLNLGAGSLSYFGMDPTYSSSLAILRRIIGLEIDRLGKPSTRAPKVKPTQPVRSTRNA